MKSTLNRSKRRARAFVPGHITGVFRIFDECGDPLHCGSVGAGFSVEAGTTTTVTIAEASTTTVTVTYNGHVIDAPVTETVVHEMMNDYRLTAAVGVDHKSDLPIGVGFGASGAGALGTAIALGSLLDKSMPLESSARYAHRAEVINRTGLGDVLAQTVGGVEIRTHPGGPGVGRIVRLLPPDGMRVVLAGHPGIETKSVLSDPDQRSRINDVGDRLVGNLIEQPSMASLIDVSKEFARSTGLMTERVKSALDDLWGAGYDWSSMVMLGDSVFCFCKDSEVDAVQEVLERHWNKSEILVTNVSLHGGGLT